MSITYFNLCEIVEYPDAPLETIFTAEDISAAYNRHASHESRFILLSDLQHTIDNYLTDANLLPSFERNKRFQKILQMASYALNISITDLRHAYNAFEDPTIKLATNPSVRLGLRLTDQKDILHDIETEILETQRILDGFPRAFKTRLHSFLAFGDYDMDYIEEHPVVSSPTNRSLDL